MRKKNNKWTLDNHKKHYYNLFLGEVDRVFGKKDIYYDEADIDTLRKKLIEDFRNITLLEDKDDVVYVEILLCDIINMINRRFGVEE